MSEVNLVPVKEVKTSFGRITLNEQGIVVFRVKPNTSLELEHVKEILEIFKSMMGDKKRPILADVREMLYFSKEAREFAGGEAYAPVRKATAVIVNSPVTLTLMNLFNMIRSNDTPFKVFASEQAAMDWLKQYV